MWTDHLLDAITESIVAMDREGHTAFCQGAERITGLGFAHPDTAFSRPVYTLCHTLITALSRHLSSLTPILLMKNR